MNVDAFVEDMFGFEPTIRYIGIVDQTYRVLASKQRESMPSYMPEDVQRNFVSIVPEIILESVEKLSPFLGPVGGTTAHYEKALVIFYRYQDLIVVISFEPKQPTPFYNRITQQFTELSAKYLRNS